MARYRRTHPYHGRKRGRPMKIVALTLLLAVLAAAIFWFVPNHIIYTEDGVMLDLPFLQGFFSTTGPTEAPPLPTYRVVIEEPATPAAPSETPEPTPSPTPEAAKLRAILIPYSSYFDENQLYVIKNQALSLGVNTLIFEYKNENGDIADAAMLAFAFSVFADTDMTREALISVGIDNTVPRSTNPAWGVKHKSGVNFLDRKANRWLNLHLPEVREYVAELCGQALEAGFDRVLLNNVSFPYEGALEAIRFDSAYAEQSPADGVTALLELLQERFGSGGLLDAVVCEETAVDGGFAPAGQDMALFRDAFATLFVVLPEDASGLGDELVPWVSATDREAVHKREAAIQGWVYYDHSGAYSEDSVAVGQENPPEDPLSDNFQ